MSPHLERLADLIVNVGANVQPGQILDVGSGPGKEELTRAITASAYKRGAKFVDVYYWDPHLKRARVKYAPDEVLDFVPSWYGERTLQLGEERAATIALTGPVEPHLFDDLDPERLGRDVFPRVKECARAVAEVGEARPPRPGTRGRAGKALGADRPHLPAGRGRPRGGVA
jgi:aminopeptidase